MRQFTATELAPESAYIFRLSAKTRQGWGEPLEATVITTEKRGEAMGQSGHLWVLGAWWARQPPTGLNSYVMSGLPLGAGGAWACRTHLWTWSRCGTPSIG